MLTSRPKSFRVPGGWGAKYPTPRQGTQTTCQRSAVPSPARNARQFPLRPRYQHLATNAAATAWAGRGITTRDKLARHGPAVRARPAPVVRSCFPSAARDRSTDYNQINIYQRPRAESVGRQMQRSGRNGLGRAACSNLE